MADRLATPATGGIDSHPDFPEFFRQARQAIYTEFAPRLETAVANGGTAALERLSAELDRRARQQATVSLRAMLNFQDGRGGPMFSRPYSAGTPTLSGVENQPEASPAPAPVGSPGYRPPPQTLAGAPVATSEPSPLAFMDNPEWAPVETPGPEADLDPRAFPAAFDRPGYRPTSGVSLGPQSRQEAQELAEERRRADEFMNAAGLGPLRRAGLNLAEGEPLPAAGNLALAAMPYRPIAGLGALATTYGGALLGDVASRLFGSSPADAQDAGADPLAGDRRQLETLLKQQAELRATATAATKRMEDERGSGIGPRFNAAKREADAANARADAMDEQVRLLNARLSPETIQQRAEYERAVRDADRARAEWEARDRQWSDTGIGRLNESLGGYSPLAFGTIFGALTRGAGRVMGHGDSVTARYVAPAITGATAGATAVNAPVIYNSSQLDVLNPRRRALEEYAARLPIGHPRRTEAEARLALPEGQGGLPTLNPIRQDALAQMEAVPTIRRSLYGALVEGAPGGVAGSELVRLLSGLRTPRTPGSTGSPGGQPGVPGGGGHGGQGGPNGQGGPQGGGPPPLGQRRSDPSFRLPENAPVAAGEVETWVSPSGRDLVTRGPDGIFRFEAGTHGRRGGQNAGDPRGRSGWRRISGVDMMMFGGIPPSDVG